MTQTIDARFLVRAGLSSDLTSGNPVPLDREMWRETDTEKIKFGDGTTPWNSLPYFAEGGGKTDLALNWMLS